tara:strand:+ start:413 stop:1297 length:885 start_codon:yes stop_codon:yes gene_type:complete
MTRLIDKGYPVESVCNQIGISRQAYHKRMNKVIKDSSLYYSVEKVVIKNRQQKTRVGLRTIYHKEGLSTLLGINRFEKEMSLRGYALKPYKSYVKTTDSRGHHHKYDNLIEGEEITGPNQVIVGDITYYTNNSGRYYIFLFTDLYTLEIKGAIASINMQGIYAEKCLNQVTRYNKVNYYGSKMIVHTDGGSQYRSDAYQRLLTKKGILPSQSISCFENGLAERINGIVKNEYLNDYNIKNVKQLNSALKEIKNQHNKLWPSSKLGWKTPLQFAQWTGGLSINEKPIIYVKKVPK